MKSGSLNLLEPSGPFQACTFTLLSLLLRNTLVDISLTSSGSKHQQSKMSLGRQRHFRHVFLIKLNENAVCIFFYFH